jgi:energy-coupling factor transporter ATP-binding protein EcfA2
VVIIGSNGAGKSTFAGFLKNIYSNDMIVFPAQKLLIYDNSINNISSNKIVDLKNIQNKNTVADLNSSIINFGVKDFSLSFSTLIYSFTSMVISEQAEYFYKKRIVEEAKDNTKKSLKKETMILDKLNDIWHKIITNITFTIDSNNMSLMPFDDKKRKYNLNAMSDGEKVILYYICNLLLADKYSYIVVDEPETYLNPAVYKTLWDVLENERHDCRFIYISHDIDFVSSRDNIDLIWMIGYNYPSDWNFKLLEKNEIPIDLQIKIYGSKKKILFCEGNYNSLDYIIYSKLFENDYTIIPVEGCSTVCNYTKLCNKSIIMANEAIGIIDNDNRSKAKIDELKTNNIFVTKYNEIEMILCDKQIIDNVISKYETGNPEKIFEFQKKFTEKIRKNIDKIALTFIKEELNQKLEKHKITSSKIDDIDNELNNFIDGYNYRKVYDNYLSKINKALEKENYDKLLQLCNLKNQILVDLANKELTQNYKEKAINMINDDIIKYLKKKYFNDLLNNLQKKPKMLY